MSYIVKSKLDLLMDLQIDKELIRKSFWIMLFGVPVIGIIGAIITKRPEASFFSTEFAIEVLFSTIVTAFNWAGCKSIVIILWRKYPWHLNPFKHLAIELTVVIGFTLGLLLGVFYLRSILSGTELDWPLFVRVGIVIVFVALLLTCFHEALFFYKQWKEHFNKSLVLEKANIKAEYDTLKSQVNPHFLFNSLNTLLSLVEDNEPAEKYIYNLSDFLRYTLDNKDSNIKSINDELVLVEKYVFLQKSRFKENLIVDIKIPEEYYHFTIPTLVLQMLVDNSIKHNIISKDKPLKISIYIDSESYIVVENNLQKRYEAKSTKQGLLNIKSRYALLSEKEIVISEEENKFTVKLPLVITEK